MLSDFYSKNVGIMKWLSYKDSFTEEEIKIMIKHQEEKPQNDSDY
jgi:hypothetical protein